jgi:hypothetical protein
MRQYDVLKLSNILADDHPISSSDGSDKYYPAEPAEYGGVLQRFLSAWEVFRGRARAVRWPDQEPSA